MALRRTGQIHDDVIKWKHFPLYWPFVWGIHQSPVKSPQKRPVTWNFDVFFDLCLNKRLSKQSKRRWSETLSRSLWRHCKDMRVSWTYHYCHLEIHCWMKYIYGSSRAGLIYPNGPEAGREAGWGSKFVPLKKRAVGSFILLHKISRTACCFGISTFLKQYSCYESATIWYADNQYLAQYSEIINNLQEIPLLFCNYAVRSCGTWRKGPGQSPCNVLSISDLELYVTETSRDVCDPVTD